jgi:hypothetical protein
MKGKEIGLFLASVALVASGCSSASATPEIRYLPATPGTGAATAGPDKGNGSATAAPVDTAAAVPVAPCIGHQEGPWAPDTKQRPEDFEVDATNGVTELDLWEPSASPVGATPAKTEYVIVLPTTGPDSRIDVIGAGTAWQYPGVCTPAQIATQISEHVAARTKEGNREVTTLTDGVTPMSVDGFNALHPGAIRRLPNGQ